MKTEDIGTRYSPWQPETDPVRLAILGKGIEEFSEAIKEMTRCIIQGIAEAHPETGEPNKCALEDELADAEAMIRLIRKEFDLSSCTDRRDKKMAVQERWYQDLTN